MTNICKSPRIFVANQQYDLSLGLTNSKYMFFYFWNVYYWSRVNCMYGKTQHLILFRQKIWKSSNIPQIFVIESLGRLDIPLLHKQLWFFLRVVATHLEWTRQSQRSSRFIERSDPPRATESDGRRHLASERELEIDRRVSGAERAARCQVNMVVGMCGRERYTLISHCLRGHTHTRAYTHNVVEQSSVELRQEISRPQTRYNQWKWNIKFGQLWMRMKQVIWIVGKTR